MTTFMQMMAKYPEVVTMAQAEIDSVTKQERLPTIDDRESIPIIDCIMREVFRCVYFSPDFGSLLKVVSLPSSINTPVPL